MASSPLSLVVFTSLAHWDCCALSVTMNCTLLMFPLVEVPSHPLQQWLRIKEHPRARVATHMTETMWKSPEHTSMGAAEPMPTGTGLVCQ